MVVFARRPLVAAARHPQALVDAVRLSLRLLLPLHHEGGGGGGGETQQGQQEAEQLQPRGGHPVRGRALWASGVGGWWRMMAKSSEFVQGDVTASRCFFIPLCALRRCLQPI